MNDEKAARKHDDHFYTALRHGLPLMTGAWLRPAVIIGAVVVLLLLNAWEFKSKRRALEDQFRAAQADGTALPWSRQQAIQAQTIEQLLHMIHTMLAAILAALLWT